MYVSHSPFYVTIPLSSPSFTMTPFLCLSFVHLNSKLRTAPQSGDQSFEHKLNKTLKASADTKNPVRVVRGYKLPSEYAPKEGYRYDGLYLVEKVLLLLLSFLFVSPTSIKLLSFSIESAAIY